MEDCHSVKLSRLLVLTVLVLNCSMFRNLTLVSYWASRSALFADIFSQARRGLTHLVTVMFYTPRGRAAIRNHGHSTRQKTLPTCRHLSKNMNCDAER